MIHQHGFWQDTNKSGHIFDNGLADGLTEMFMGKIVIDIGCGTGDYVRHLRKNGIYTLGVDGNPYTPEFDVTCQCYDFAIPQNLGQHDWVMSIEVGEHIPNEYEDCFLENLDRHNKIGIVLSWAVVGQPGRGHVNCHDNQYVKDKMTLLGYSNDIEAETRLRACANHGHLRKTIMVFVK